MYRYGLYLCVQATDAKEYVMAHMCLLEGRGSSMHEMTGNVLEYKLIIGR